VPRRLADIDLSVLEELVPESVRALREAARIDGAPSATRAPQG
jgi:hypothetical protein